MSGQVAITGDHDVRYDGTGFWGGTPRLTCYGGPGCQGDTFVAQPWMNTPGFVRMAREFLEKHQPLNGLVTDADRRRPALSPNDLLGRLES